MRHPLVVLALALVATPAALAQQPAARVPANSTPAVSPDGAHIAFISDRDGAANLYLIGPDGAQERQLTTDGAARPDWSPDGAVIRFARRGADSGAVFAIGLTGGTPRRIAVVPGRNPVPSPDGSRVAFIIGPWTASATAVANADGSGVHPIAGGAGTTAWNAAWSPDGSRIAYTYGDSSRVLQVHVLNADGSGDHPVTHMPAEEGSAQMPAWSRDGRRLAVQVSNGHTHTGHIWVVDLATGQARRLAAHADSLLDEIPSWFPDGTRIAFQSNRSGRMEIWVMSADGSAPRQLTGVPR